MKSNIFLTYLKKEVFMRRKNISIFCMLVVFFCMSAFIIPQAAVGKELPINPITPNVKNKIKESTRILSDVEDRMAPKVNEMEKMFKFYKQSCEGKDDDRGCVEIKTQIGQKYGDVLRTMEQALPKLKQSLSSSARELSHSIKKQTRGRDVNELYRDVAKKGSLPRARGALSKRLLGLLNAVGKSGSNVSLLELSLRTEADLISSTQILDYLEAEISRQIMMIDVSQGLPVLSPEMVGVMNSVSGLFGFDDVEFEAEMYEKAASNDSYGGDDWRD